MAHIARNLPQKVVVHHHIKQQPLSQNLKKALVSLGLEDIYLSEESIADFYLFDAGKISKQEALKRVVSRVKLSKK